MASTAKAAAVAAMLVVFAISSIAAAATAREILVQLLHRVEAQMKPYCIAIAPEKPQIKAMCRQSVLGPIIEKLACGGTGVVGGMHQVKINEEIVLASVVSLTSGNNAKRKTHSDQWKSAVAYVAQAALAPALCPPETRAALASAFDQPVEQTSESLGDWNDIKTTVNNYVAKNGILLGRQ